MRERIESETTLATWRLECFYRRRDDAKRAEDAGTLVEKYVKKKGLDGKKGLWAQLKKQAPRGGEKRKVPRSACFGNERRK